MGISANLATPDGQGRSVVEGALVDRLEIAELDEVDKSLLSLAVPLAVPLKKQLPEVVLGKRRPITVLGGDHIIIVSERSVDRAELERRDQPFPGHRPEF